MMDRTRRARLAGSLAIFLFAVAPATARGQADPQRTLAAQALYEQATAEMDAGRYASACHKLEEVTKLVPEGLGAKLTLGQCYEALGKRASAWTQFALVEVMAAKAGQEERSKVAGERAAALKPQLAMLSIEVPEGARSLPGLVVTRDGVPLGDAQWGLPLPVDAGSHEVMVTAPGRKPWRQTVDVPRDGEKLSVRVKALEVDPNAALKTPGPAGDPAPQRPWQRPLGIGAMALGGAGVTVGAVLGGLALTKNGESNKDNHCDAQDRCDDVGLDLRDQAVGLGNGSTAAIVAGAVVLAGGVVLFTTAPPATTKEERSGAGAGAGRWSARVEFLPGGMRVKGSW
ncbi:MAG TPA: hypothetical protein VE093_04240 [Polyangiaceae bacterium]|nr:hypothetical protein [Polyangiaceae bacterium]